MQPLRSKGGLLTARCLCPFLYQTITIQTPYPQHIANSARQVHKSPNPPSSYQSNDRRQSAQHKSSSDSALDRGQSIHSFLKRKAQEVDPSNIAHGATPRLQSTLTRDERRAFKALQRLESPLSQEQHTAGSDPFDLNVDNILALFAPRGLHRQHESSQHEHQSYNLDNNNVDLDSRTTQPPKALHPHSYTPTRIHETSQALLRHISQRLELAATSPTTSGFTLWQEVQNLIFPLLKLTPDSSDHRSTLDTRSSSVDPTKVTLPVELASLIPAEMPALPLLSTIYPAAMLLAARYMLTYTPASKTLFSLLTEIRAKGAVSYILAANVHLYNILLLVRWRVYSDLPGIEKLLVEMRLGGVRANDVTLSVLGEIEDKMNQEIKDDSAREQAWWTLQSRQGALTGLFGEGGWKDVLAGQLREGTDSIRTI